MRLNHYSMGDYTPGASILMQILWYFIGSPIVRSYLLPFSGLKVLTLRLFGARLGRGVRVKPGVKIKFPWRLEVGDYSWLGEDAWIDNLACVRIGHSCCLSQGVYLCTGNHDWSSDQFDLIPAEIQVADRVWISAFSKIAPGVVVAEGAVLTLGSVAVSTIEPWSINRGNPAEKIGQRSIKDRPVSTEE